MSVRPIRLHSVAGLASLAVLLAAAVPASALAGTAPKHPASAHTAPSVINSAASRLIARPVAVRSSCASVRARLAPYAAHDTRPVVCVKSGLPVKAAKAQGLPSICQSNMELVGRFVDCLDSGWKLTILDSDGEVVGTATGATIFWNTVAYNSRSWTENIEVQVHTVTGAAVGSSFTAPLQCNDQLGTCLATGSGSWAGQGGYLPAIPGRTYTGQLGYGSFSTLTAFMTFQVNMVFKTSAGNAPSTIGPNRADIRCDSASYFNNNGGCAYPFDNQNYFRVSISDPTVTQAAQFMDAAQDAIPNHVGDIGYKQLTRLTNKTTISRNRSVACKNIHPGPGQSCDEYPFASTYQGASLVPPGYWKAMALNAKQNSKVGSLFSSFLLKNRIIDGDPFWVVIQ